jgi:hypothetical protein
MNLYALYGKLFFLNHERHIGKYEVSDLKVMSFIWDALFTAKVLRRKVILFFFLNEFICPI